MTVLDLIESMGIKPKQKSGTHGGEYASPCPSCGGDDRFLIWPSQGIHGTWFCRGCDKGGDAIQFLRDFQGLSFGEACQELGIEHGGKPRRLTMPKQARTHAPEKFTPKERQSPESQWRKKAGELLRYAHAKLLANAGELSRLEKRGLPLEAVRFFKLGWLPGEKGRDCYHRARSAWGLPEETDAKGKVKKLWIPRGLVIPAFDEDGQVIRLRIRRPDSDRERFLPKMKFAVVPGSVMGPLLLNAQNAKACAVIESELDGMATSWSAIEAELPVATLSVGTNLSKPDALAHAFLQQCIAILVALDFDEPDEKGNRPGAKGFVWWKEQYRAAERWPVPEGKDPGEAALTIDLAAWLRAGLPSVLVKMVSVQKSVEASNALPSESPSYNNNTDNKATHGKGDAKAPEGTQEDFNPISAGASRENSKPVGPSSGGMAFQGGGKSSQGSKDGDKGTKAEQVTSPRSGNNNRMKGVDWLSHPLGPKDSLKVLERAGLRVVKSDDDFRIFGQERWPFEDAVRLMDWMCRHGEWVRRALYNTEKQETRV